MTRSNSPHPFPISITTWLTADLNLYTETPFPKSWHEAPPVYKRYTLKPAPDSIRWSQSPEVVREHVFSPLQAASKSTRMWPMWITNWMRFWWGHCQKRFKHGINCVFHRRWRSCGQVMHMQKEILCIDWFPIQTQQCFYTEWLKNNILSKKILKLIAL